MTKRAIAIQGFVAELTTLAVDGTTLKMGMAGSIPSLPPDMAVERLIQAQRNLQAYMVEILENNPEQADALLAELNLKWINPPSE